MGIREYIFQKLVLTPNNVGYLSQILQANIAASMKEAIMETLSDEELAANVALYADTLVDRELKRFWGSVGGTQKGLNFAAQQANPITDIVTSDGALNLAGIINMFARRFQQNQTPIGQIPQKTPEKQSNEYREVPPM